MKKAEWVFSILVLAFHLVLLVFHPVAQNPKTYTFLI
jgi:hypothetical protein